MPFAKTFSVKQDVRNYTVEDVKVPSGKYQLAMNPSAFFSVIFVESTITTPENPVTLNYTWYGQNNFTITGEWLDLNLTFKYEKEGET